MSALRIVFSLLCLGVFFLQTPNIVQAQEGIKDASEVEEEEEKKDGLEPEDQDEFKWLMEIAAEAREEKRYEDVVSILLKAHNKYPSPTLLFNLAKAYQENGECENAIGYFAEAASLSQAKENDDPIEGLVIGVMMSFQCQGNEADLTQIYLENNIEQDKSGVIHIGLSSLFIQKGKCAAARSHLLRATEASKEGSGVSLKAMENLRVFKCTSVKDEVDQKVVAKDPQVIIAAPQEEKETNFDTLDYVSFSTMGVGGLLMVGGLVADFFTLGTIEEYRVSAANGGSTQRHYDLKEEAETGQMVTLIFYTAGGVLAAGGLTLFLVNQMDGETAQDSSQSGQLSVTPIISKEFIGAGLRLDLF